MPPRSTRSVTRSDPSAPLDGGLPSTKTKKRAARTAPADFKQTNKKRKPAAPDKSQAKIERAQVCRKERKNKAKATNKDARHSMPLSLRQASEIVELTGQDGPNKLAVQSKVNAVHEVLNRRAYVHESQPDAVRYRCEYCKEFTCSIRFKKRRGTNPKGRRCNPSKNIANPFS